MSKAIAKVLFGRLRLTPLHRDAAQISERLGDFSRILAEQLATHLERILQAPLGGFQLPLLREGVANLIQHRSDFGMRGAMQVDQACVRLLEQRLRLFRQSETVVDAPHRSHERRARVGLRREARFDLPRTPVQKLARRHLIALPFVRIGELKEVDEERRHLFGAHAFACSALHLHVHRDGEADQQQDARGRHDHAGKMARSKLSRAIDPGISSGENGTTAQITSDVRRQLLHSGVAALRLRPQRLGDDRVQVACQRTPEPLRRRVALFGNRVRVIASERSAAERRRFSSLHVPLEFTRRHLLPAKRSATRQQQIQQDGQGIDVGRCRDRLAEDLFGRSEIRRQGASAYSCELRLLSWLFSLHEFRDAEIEKFDLAPRRHEDVGWFEIPMDHQVRVCMRDRVAHLQEETEARRDIQISLVAPAIDRLTLHVLEHQIQRAERRGARVQKPRDVRMRKLSQNPAFANEALPRRGLCDVGVQQLERDEALEAPVAAAGEPDVSHTPGAQPSFELIDAEAGACFEGRRGKIGADAGVHTRVAGEKTAQLG